MQMTFRQFALMDAILVFVAPGQVNAVLVQTLRLS